MQEAQMGDRVRIQYAWLRPDVPANSEELVPSEFEFTVGSSDIIPSVSLGVIGMAPGEHKRIALQPQINGDETMRFNSRNPQPRPFDHPQVRTINEESSLHATLHDSEGLTGAGTRSGSWVFSGVHLSPGEVIEIEIMLLSLDSSSNANQNHPQFDLGGEA